MGRYLLRSVHHNLWRISKIELFNRLLSVLKVFIVLFTGRDTQLCLKISIVKMNLALLILFETNVYEIRKYNTIQLLFSYLMS
jgi:hypothetical protein